MIFVTVGGDTHSFIRLFTEVNKLIENKKICEDVIFQTGYTDFNLTNYFCFDFMNFENFNTTIKQSDIIITHAGAGTISTALKYGKPVIVVPRRKHFNEHINDHQINLTNKLRDLNRIIAVYDINDLESVLQKIKKFKPNTPRSSSNEIIQILKTL